MSIQNWGSHQASSDSNFAPKGPIGLRTGLNMWQMISSTTYLMNTAVFANAATISLSQLHTNIEARLDPIGTALIQGDRPTVIGEINAVIHMFKGRIHVENDEKEWRDEILTWVRGLQQFAVDYNRRKIDGDKALEHFHILRGVFPEGYIEVDDMEILEETPGEALEAVTSGQTRDPKTQDEVILDLTSHRGRITQQYLWGLIRDDTHGVARVPDGGQLILEMAESASELQRIGFGLWAELKNSPLHFIGQRQIILRNPSIGRQVRLQVNRDGRGSDFLTVSPENI